MFVKYFDRGTQFSALAKNYQSLLTRPLIRAYLNNFMRYFQGMQLIAFSAGHSEKVGATRKDPDKYISAI